MTGVFEEGYQIERVLGDGTPTGFAWDNLRNRWGRVTDIRLSFMVQERAEEIALVAGFAIGSDVVITLYQWEIEEE